MWLQDTKGSYNPALILINKNKETYYLLDFAVPADHRMKIKMKKTWQIMPEQWKCHGTKVTVIPVIVGLVWFYDISTIVGY